MPRTLSPGVLAQVQAGQLRPAFFLEIAFLTETVWLWSGLGSNTPPGPAYGPTTFPYGQTFLGMGWLGQIRAVPAVTDVIAQNVTLVLSGIPTELVTDAINAVRQNSIATLWLAVLDGSNNVIGDPVQIFAGSLDVPTLVEGAETSTLSITAENPLIDLNRSPQRRFTDIDQQTDFPGDTGFFQVQLLQDYDVTWPSPIAGTPDTTPPPNFLTITPAGPVILAVGATQQLVCIETRSDGALVNVMPTGGASWGGPVYSSDPSIASVSSTGLVTANAMGMCIITKRFVQSMFLGGGPNKPSNNVSASVVVIVGIPV
jgi:hypothetical protein